MNELFVPIDEEEMLETLSDYLDDNDKIYPYSCKGCEKVINIIIDLYPYEDNGLRIADIQEEYSGKRGIDGHLKSLDAHLRHLERDGFTRRDSMQDEEERSPEQVLSARCD
ncbi:MAG: hypothetical protein AAE987_00010 [Thermoplasmataceae archaeon]|jgi:hypothetical protein